MKITSIQATWVHVPIPHERQHTSNFGRIASFDSVEPLGTIATGAHFDLDRRRVRA